MRYYFDCKIEAKENGGFVQIPFNIWEVCKQREVIQADVVLDNRIIAREFLPVEKGNYMIHLKNEDLEGVDLSAPHKLLLHVSGSLIRMDQHSPYSFENPIREIDGIDIILQPSDGLCGQTCVAMLAGVTIAEVINVMDCREWQATMGRMISALNYFGIDHTDIINYTQGDPNVVLPKCCILMEKLGRFSHYLLHYDGKYYDPNLGVMDEYDFTQLRGYLEIKCV